jgi:hypothetical protein
MNSGCLQEQEINIETIITAHNFEAKCYHTHSRLYLKDRKIMAVVGFGMKSGNIFAAVGTYSMGTFLISDITPRLGFCLSLIKTQFLLDIGMIF